MEFLVYFLITLGTFAALSEQTSDARTKGEDELPLIPRMILAMIWPTLFAFMGLLALTAVVDKRD